MMLKDKNIIITGASSGLGKALAFYSASLGANLVICARNKENIIDVEQSIKKLYPTQKIKALVIDVCIKEDNEKLVNEAISFLGSIDIFIANAAKSMWSRFSDVEEVNDMKELMVLNYMSVVYASYYTLPYLKKSQGSFVVISSIQGVLPVPYHTGYVASKHAVNSFIETLKLEEPNIHFLLAMPSWIAGTDLRKNALVSHTKNSIKVQTTHNKNIITKEECAQKIIESLINKEEYLYIPKKYKFIQCARIFFKKLTDKIVLNKVNKQIKN